ncbi:hypothetical protein LINPERPRIM_LOCUS538 [Linum perenne]
MSAHAKSSLSSILAVFEDHRMELHATKSPQFLGLKNRWKGYCEAWVGQPSNKYVRDGFDVNVCVVRDVSIDPVDSIHVVLDDDQLIEIKVLCPKVRSYKRKNAFVWIVDKGVASVEHIGDVEVSTTVGQVETVAMRHDGESVSLPKLAFMDFMGAL